MGKHSTFMNGMGLALYGLLVLSFLASGCATTSGVCPTAREIARDYGKVVDRCAVSDADGNVRVKTIFVRHCGL